MHQGKLEHARDLRVNLPSLHISKALIYRHLCYKDSQMVLYMCLNGADSASVVRYFDSIAQYRGL
jgi:hypothetical protein